MVAVLVAAVTLSVPGADASARGAAVHHGVGAGAFAYAAALGPLAPHSVLAVDVELRPRDPGALERFAMDVSTPGTASYGQFLAPGAFANRFGPTPSAMSLVRAWLDRAGLSFAVARDHLTVRLHGTANDVERALGVRVERYRLSGGRTAYANTTAPRIPAAVRPFIEGVLGLRGVMPPSDRSVPPRRTPPSRGHRDTTAGPVPCTAAVQAGTKGRAYTANQFASAYDFSGLYAKGDEGAGVTIAFFELGPNLTSDIAGYQSCFGTNAAVTYREVDGGAGSGPGDGEAALDIETAIGLAPQAKFEVYQAPSSPTGIIDNFTAMIDDDTAKVISTSWGQCEARSSSTLLATEGTLFEQAATQGQSVFAATGDYGSSDCRTSALTVDDPASQPFVTGVGGTTLSALGPPPTETTWNDSSIRTGAGGGGVSSEHEMPSYQVDAPASLHVVGADSSGAPCGAPAGSFCREVPDVAADADRSTGYLIYYEGKWESNGGTSAASPLWAALMALVDASSSCRGETVGFADPALYDAAATSYASEFHDVTTGTNDYTPQGNKSGLFPATVGYDMATGLGTPIAAKLAVSLCSYRTRNVIDTKTLLHVARASIAYGAENREVFTVVVTGHAGDGWPLGDFRVLDHSKLLCRGALRRESSTNAFGSCRLTAKQLGTGRYPDIFALFVPATASSSDAKVRYVSSRSAPAAVLVQKAR
jgi:subtilase family serine protease